MSCKYNYKGEEYSKEELIDFLVYNGKNIQALSDYDFKGDWINDPQNASKVVDENGEPMVVWHGTEKTFTEFKSERSAQGVFWFSEDKGKIERGESGAESVSEIMPVFLNIKDIAGWNEYENKSIDEIERDGFDGVKLDDDYISFNPNQIKSATDNIGTFNVENNDIRYQIIGEKGAMALDKAEEATFRMDNLRVAREMETAKKTPKEIRMATGWERGADGLWRYEVSDFTIDKDISKIPNTKLVSQGRVYEYKEATLADIVKDDKGLFNTYPDAKNIKIVFYDFQHPQLTRGQFREGDDQIMDDTITMWGIDFQKLTDKQYSTLLHETQHFIQRKEKFAIGGNLDSVKKQDLPINSEWVKFNSPENQAKYKEYTELYNSLEYREELFRSNELFEEEYSKRIDELYEDESLSRSERSNKVDAIFEEFREYSIKNFPTMTKANEIAENYIVREPNRYISGHEAYNRLAGEVEARNVQTRMDMTPEQRLETLLSETEDVAREDQIFLNQSAITQSMASMLEDEGLLYNPKREYGVSPQENKTLREAEEQEQLKRLNLEKLNEISEEYEQGNRIFKRLPQREQSGFTRIGRTGIEAAIHLDAVFGANENGAANKAEQERALKEYAKRSNVWVEDIVQQRGEPHTEGQEALVWFNEDTNIVTKSILPLEQTPQEFLDRVSIHNSIFPETQIKVIGFTETKSGELQYIVEQPLVVFERGATQAEVSEMMSKLGFEHTGENDYANNETLIEDLHPGNALIDINTRRVAVIDAIIRLNTKEAGYGGERIVGTNNVSELEKSLAEEEVRQQEVEQENIFKRDVLNILVKNNLISNDTFLQLSSLESFNVENVSSILRNNEEAFEGMSDRSIGKKLMSITPVNFEYIFNKWGESFSNEYVEDYVDSLIRNNIVEMRDEDNNICASHGLFFNGVKFGGTWKVVKDLKGKPSHKLGGVDIELTEKGVKVAKGGTDIIAEKGLVFSSRFDVSDKGLRGGSKWFIEKDLKGYRSHNKGGVDIELTDNGVYLRKEGSPEIVAENGVLILNNI